MKITQITCPTCGAQIDNDGKRTISFCEYCGNRIAVETAHSVGYDLERGRIDARTDMVRSLADEVLAVTEPLCNLEPCKRNINAVNKKKNELIKLVSNKEKSAVYAPYIWPLSGGAIVLLFLIVFHAPFLVFVLCGVATICCVYLEAYRFLSALDNLKARLARKESQFNELNQRLESYTYTLSQHKDIEIPLRYRNKEALAYVYTTLKGQGALSIEEALYKYEIANQQKQMLNIQAQQIAEMRELRRRN